MPVSNTTLLLPAVYQKKITERSSIYCLFREIDPHKLMASYPCHSSYKTSLSNSRRAF